MSIPMPVDPGLGMVGFGKLLAPQWVTVDQLDMQAVRAMPVVQAIPAVQAIRAAQDLLVVQDI